MQCSVTEKLVKDTNGRQAYKGVGPYYPYENKKELLFSQL